jgi:hypothetical protein
MPIRSEGYRMNDFECGPNGLCQYHFRKQDRAYITAFKERYQEVAVDGVRFALDDRGADFSRQFDVPATQPERDEAFLKEVPKARVFYERLLERFHALENAGLTGIERTARQPRQVANLTPPDASFPVLHEGSIEIKLDQVWQLDRVLDLLENPYISVTKFHVAVGESPTITLEAQYVVSQ